MLSHRLSQAKLITELDVNLSTEKLLDIINDTINRFATVKTIKVTQQEKSWITNTVKNAIVKRNKLSSEMILNRDSMSHKLKFIMQRNKVTSLIRKAKRQYYHSRFNESLGNNNKVFNTIKEVLGTKTNHMTQSL